MPWRDPGEAFFKRNRDGARQHVTHVPPEELIWFRQEPALIWRVVVDVHPSRLRRNIMSGIARRIALLRASTSRRRAR